MSICRPSSTRLFSNKVEGCAPPYVYISAGDQISWDGYMIPSEDMVEIVCRVLLRAGMTPTINEVNAIRKGLLIPDQLDMTKMEFKKQLKKEYSGFLSRRNVSK